MSASSRRYGGAMPCAMTFCMSATRRYRLAASGTGSDTPLVLVATLVVVSAVFAAAPKLDLWASGLFAPESGGFPLSHDPTLLALRDLNRVLPIGIVGGLIMALLGRSLGATTFVVRLPRPTVVLSILGTYLVGPLGIVHLLKNTIGRARPQDVLAFGGQDRFTTAWQFSDACLRNCSSRRAKPRRPPCCRCWRCSFLDVGGRPSSCFLRCSPPPSPSTGSRSAAISSRTSSSPGCWWLCRP
nr:hypothetical protein [Aureimonas sp. SK2]